MRLWRRYMWGGYDTRALLDELAGTRLVVDVNGHRLHDLSLLDLALMARFTGPERTIVRGTDEAYRVRVVRAV